jgi:predicted DNA-binding transcriptional regulator AlpA
MNTEYLTIEQFASRLQLSRSTAYAWIAQGRLVAGRHVLHIGGVIRVIWSDNLMNHLLELSKCKREPVERPLLKKEGKGGRNRIGFDSNYLQGLPRNMV